MAVLAKTRGAVGCSHCQRLDANARPCDLCHRLICPRCAEDTLASCPEPAAPVLAIGFGRRLLCVDERGRLALVFGLEARVLDLQRRCWVAFNPAAHLLQMGPWPVLGPTGLVSARMNPIGRELRWGTIILDEIQPGGQRYELPTPAVKTITSLTLCDQGTCAVLIGDGLARCFDLRTREPILSDGVPAAVAGYSSAAGVLVTGEEERLALRRVQPGSPPEVVSTVRLERPVAWLAVAGGRIAALLEKGALLTWRLPDGIGSDPLTAGTAAIAHPALASLSPDGRLVAVADGETIRVHDLEGGAPQVLEGHDGAVTFVRFARGGDWLISAAASNQVIQWPRRTRGFADRTIKVKLARDPREFPAPR